MFLILIFSYVISSFSLLATNASQMATTITQVTTSDNVLHLRLNNRESIQDQLIKALEENNIEEFQRLWTLYCKNPSEIDFYALALNLENWEIINFLLNQQVSIPCAIITKLLEAAQNNTQILQALMDYKDKNQQSIHDGPHDPKTKRESDPQTPTRFWNKPDPYSNSQPDGG